MLSWFLTALAAGAIGLFLAMPGRRLLALRAGGLVLAVVAAFLLAMIQRSLGGAPWGWYVGLALVMLVAAVRVITHAKPVYSALYFVLLVTAGAGLMVLLGAELLAYALIIVYAGAILVTYLFVIMLAQQAHPAPCDTRAREPFWGCLTGFFLLALLGMQLFNSGTVPDANAMSRVAAAAGPDNLTVVGTRLLTEYMVGIQIIGVLLLAAMVGAIAIARRETPTDELAEEVD